MNTPCLRGRRCHRHSWGRREQGCLHATPASCRPIGTTVGPNHFDGKPIRRLEDKHTHVEWLRFFERIDELTIHVVDDYATHKHAKVRAWLAEVREPNH